MRQVRPRRAVARRWSWAAGRRGARAARWVPPRRWPGGLRIAIGVGGAIAAFEPNLVWSMRFRPLHEELLVEGDAALRLGVELHHPALNPLGVELRIDGAVERIGEVDAPAIATDFNHLGPAAERAVPRARMCGLGDNAADANLA